MTVKTSSSRLSRRHVLAGLGLGLAATNAVAAPRLGAGGSWLGGGSASLDRAGKAEWARQLGREFTVIGESGRVKARLVEVSPLTARGKRPSNVRDEAFALVFEATSGTLPPGDRTYPVRGDNGALHIFFTDCGAACGGRRLQAVFG